MDQRLSRLSGTRAQKLRKEDLPEVAWALVYLIQGKGSLSQISVNGTPIVVLTDHATYDVHILREDWLLISPFILDGTFDPLTYPVPVVVASGSETRSTDPIYSRVLASLEQVFTVGFPT